MGRNLRIMKAYVVVQCISGLGDQYSSLLSASVIKSELDRMGYDVYLLWNVRSLYMPSDYPLDFLFDLTSFGPVEYNLEEAIKKEYHLLPQIQQSIRIYVSEINLFLQEYQSTFYDHSSFRRLGSNIPIFKKQYLSKEVLEIKNRFLEGKKEIYGIHFRVGDSFLNTPIELLEPYRNSIEEVETFIKENPSTEIMICSNNKTLPSYLSNKYANVFNNNFSYDIQSYYSYQGLGERPLTEYKKHTQEVAAEMACFAECSKIRTVSSFSSSFLTYGIAHNRVVKDWDKKFEILFT